MLFTKKKLIHISQNLKRILPIYLDGAIICLHHKNMFSSPSPPLCPSAEPPSVLEVADEDGLKPARGLLGPYTEGATVVISCSAKYGEFRYYSHMIKYIGSNCFYRLQGDN